MAATRTRRGSTSSGKTVKARPTAVVALDDKLDVTKAAALKAAFLDKRGAPVTVDASAVQHLGAQCAQVLLSARNTWVHDGQSFQIAPSSDTFRDGLRLLGLSNELGNCSE